MENLLPTFPNPRNSTKSKSNYSEWIPAAADAKLATISPQLQAAFQPDEKEIIRFKSIPKARPEPNFLDRSVIIGLGPSPIDEKSRGLPEKPFISVDRLNLKSYDQQLIRPLKHHFYNELVIHLTNKGESPMDVFIQRKSSMLSSVLQPKKDVMRLIEGDPNILQKNISKEILMCIYCGSYNRSTSLMNSRKELRDFAFNSDTRIGLEVEMIESKLVCSKVVPGTQASAFEKDLLGAEILAINKNRVLNLTEFQDTLQVARESREVVLTIVSFIGGKNEDDDIYLAALQKKARVKSLLSNYFFTEKEKARGLKSYSSDEEEEEESKGKAGRNNHEDAEEGDEEGEDEAEAEAEQHDKEEKNLDDSERGKGAFHDKNNKNADLHEDSSLREAKLLSFAEESVVGDDRRDRKDSAGDDEYQYEEEEGALIARRKVVRYDSDALDDTIQFEAEGKDDGDDVDNSQSIVVKAEDKASDDKSVHSADSSGSWNVLTKVGEKILQFVALVCMPSQLSRSHSWGNPNKYMQFSNFSKSFRLEVFWIDEDGALITRAEVKTGLSQFELCSSSHVWAVVASQISTNKSGNMSSTSSMDSSGSSVILVFRPSESALQEGKCVSVLWSPGSSISIAQTIISKSSNKEVASSSAKSQKRFYPSIHIQLFEPTKSNVEQGSLVDYKQSLDSRSSMRNKSRIRK